MNMKKFVVTILFVVSMNGTAFAGQDTEDTSPLFEEIRGNEALLQMFFTQMPKGGDLHNHLTGSVYAETYFGIAQRENMWLNTDSYVLNANAACDACIQLDYGMANEHNVRVRAIDAWSVRNYGTYSDVRPVMNFSSRHLAVSVRYRGSARNCCRNCGNGRQTRMCNILKLC